MRSRSEGLSTIVGDGFLFDLPHWSTDGTTAPSLADFWPTDGDGNNAQGSPSHAPDLPLDAMAAASEFSGVNDPAVLSGGDNDDSSQFHATDDGRISTVGLMEALKFQTDRSDEASSTNGPGIQLAKLTSASDEKMFSLDGWSGISDAAGAEHQPPGTPGSSTDPTGPSFGPDAVAGFAFDAKGGTTGSPGSHGGGGGGTGLLTSYVSGDANVGDASEFNIQINFSGSWTAKQQTIVTWAADTWSKIITADIRDDTDLNGNLIDDIVISVSTGRIDGNGNPITGNVLAQTGSIVVRDPGTIDQWLPLTASIKLDSTDLKSSAFADAWDDIVLHEMGHALGFIGAIFDQLGLVDGAGYFTGTNATLAYGGLVPLENDGGSGTAGSHWDEAGFMPNDVAMPNELMTGYFVPGEQTYLSDTTVGALADLGYTVQDPSVGTYLIVDSHLLIV